MSSAVLNRSFPSCCDPHYESEAKCKTVHMKISFGINVMEYFKPGE